MAVVKQTNADVYLYKHASIFAYHPPSRALVWGCYNHGKGHWELHKNGFTVEVGHAPLGKRDTAKLLTHYEMLHWLKACNDPAEELTDNYIRGRISPDKSTIYIHDMNARYHHPMIERKWPIHIKNALHKIAMYMKEQTTED